MIYRAAVFDLDGTLLNTLADLAASGNELLASYGMKPHTQQAYRYFVGNGSRKLMERILPNASSGRIDEALARYKAIYERRLTEETAPYEGIMEMLSGLRERGVRLAVCTNKHINAAAQLIQKFFPSDIYCRNIILLLKNCSMQTSGLLPLLSRKGAIRNIFNSFGNPGAKIKAWKPSLMFYTRQSIIWRLVKDMIPQL